MIDQAQTNETSAPWPSDKLSFLTVSSSISFSLTSNPIPEELGGVIVPRGLTVIGGSTISLSQYRAGAETSPGSVNPESVDIAML